MLPLPRLSGWKRVSLAKMGHCFRLRMVRVSKPLRNYSQPISIFVAFTPGRFSPFTLKGNLLPTSPPSIFQAGGGNNRE